MSVQFPVTVFVVGDKNNSHEIFLTKSSIAYLDLLKLVVDLVKGSRNCEKFVASQQAANENKATLVAKELVVYWSTVGRDDHFPKRTVIHPGNCQAVLRLLELGAGKDVMEANIGVAEPKAKDTDVNKEPKEPKEPKEGKEGKEGKEDQGSQGS